jgi:hypothetical protein
MWDLVDAMIAVNRIDDGVQVVAQRAVLWPDDAEQQYWSAWEYAKLAQAAAGEEEGQSRQRFTELQRQCLAALGRANELGFHDAEQLRSNTTIDRVVGEGVLEPMIRKMQSAATKQE